MCFYHFEKGGPRMETRHDVTDQAPTGRSNLAVALPLVVTLVLVAPARM